MQTGSWYDTPDDDGYVDSDESPPPSDDEDLEDDDELPPCMLSKLCINNISFAFQLMMS
jgi:hypothetical protein